MTDEERRAAFSAWFSGPPMNGDRDALIRKCGLTKGRISQLFTPGSQFGERAARALAVRLGLQAEFFNTPAQKTVEAGLRGPMALDFAFDAIDAALAPLDDDARAYAVELLAGLRKPGRAKSVLAAFTGAIESSKRRVA